MQIHAWSMEVNIRSTQVKDWLSWARALAFLPWLAEPPPRRYPLTQNGVSYKYLTVCGASTCLEWTVRESSLKFVFKIIFVTKSNSIRT